MKFILFLVFAFSIIAEDQINTQNQSVTQPTVEKNKKEKVKKVFLEMTPEVEPEVNSKNTVKLEKNPKKVQERELRQEKRMRKMRQLFLKDVDKMIKNFNLDRELDESKLDVYFKDLEDQLFNNMKENFLANKEYTDMYDNLVQEYNNIKKTYE